MAVVFIHIITLSGFGTGIQPHEITAPKPPHEILQLYPMASVEISGERRCWELHGVPAPSDPHFRGSWDKSKSPYPLRNCIIPKLATAGTPRTTWPVASWFLGPGGCLIENYATVQSVRVLALLSNSCRFMLHYWSYKVYLQKVPTFTSALLHHWGQGILRSRNPWRRQSQCWLDRIQWQIVKPCIAFSWFTVKSSNNPQWHKIENVGSQDWGGKYKLGKENENRLLLVLDLYLQHLLLISLWTLVEWRIWRAWHCLRRGEPSNKIQIVQGVSLLKQYALKSQNIYMF